LHRILLLSHKNASVWPTTTTIIIHFPFSIKIYPYVLTCVDNGAACNPNPKLPWEHSCNYDTMPVECRGYDTGALIPGIGAGVAGQSSPTQSGPTAPPPDSPQWSIRCTTLGHRRGGL
jgi:hypothetical protein